MTSISDRRWPRWISPVPTKYSHKADLPILIKFVSVYGVIVMHTSVLANTQSVG
jgi:hypothetical protein